MSATAPPPSHQDAQEIELIDALRRLNLLRAAESVRFVPLSGGVSSDILMARVGERTLCIKRALAKLKVTADWRAPVERNHYEAQWMRLCASIEPRMVPAVLGEDRDHGVFVMEYLEPTQHPQWKAQLAAGQIDAQFAAEVGSRLARVHAATARSESIGQQFATDHIFIPIRIEPYLLATARAHPDRAAELMALAQCTANTRLALVHGDVSPKNILAGTRGPVLLDAECAWYGDPAFDLAFCLNHLLLKCLWHPRWTLAYLDSFASLARAYLAGVSWESTSTLETRAARLLPGLLLARVDGKSPAEYITQDWQKETVRMVGRELLRDPSNALTNISARWRTALADRMTTDA